MERDLTPPDSSDSCCAYHTVDVTVRMKVCSSLEFAEHNAMVLCEGVVRVEGWTVVDAELIER